MKYKRVGSSNVEISILGLGGHEYLPNGKSRGFNEDFAHAVRPGYTAEGYGGDKRRSLLAMAFAHGINFFDVTIDPEKEALGRNLQEIIPPYEIYIQTRPEGMGYGYDENNHRMAVFELLKAEVERILKLLRRDHLDFLNLPFQQSAIEADAEYIDKIRDNVARLKQLGLIRFATADNSSGERTYLAQVGAGCFDALAINFNFADHGPLQRVLPQAQQKGMAVITREAFLKGRLFELGDAAGLTDRALLARVALKWNLASDAVTTTLVGAGDTGQLLNSLTVVDHPALSPEEDAAMQQLVQSPLFAALVEDYRKRFTV